MARKLASNFRNWHWFIPPVLVTLGIFLLSTVLAFPVQVEGVSYFDKLQHCFAYFVFIIAFLVAFKQTERLTSSLTYKMVIIGSLYGFTLEIIQYAFFSYRTFEWIDALANVLGVLIGYLVFNLFKRG